MSSANGTYRVRGSLRYITLSILDMWFVSVYLFYLVLTWTGRIKITLKRAKVFENNIGSFK